MRVAIIGRTDILLTTCRELIRRGHEIPIICTCKAEDFYTAKETDFADYARDIGATFLCSGRLDSDEIIESLLSLECDIAISINWINIISQKVIELFPLGILNAHAGDLPRYRGNACPNWAIINNEEFVGLCVHLMVPELDAGPVVLRDKFHLNANTYISDVYDWLKSRTPELLIESAEGLFNEKLEACPQSINKDSVYRTYPRRTEDSRINWKDSADNIHRLIRASSKPFAGAYSYLENETKIIIWRAEIYVPEFGFSAVPGQVCFSINGEPIIACKENMLKITDAEISSSDSNNDVKKTILSSFRNRLV